MIAQKMMTAERPCASVIANAPIAYASSPSTYARLRPMRSPILLLTRMNAAETRASSAIALCTPLTVVSRSFTTAEIDTFISDVSTTSTNIAIASSSDNRVLPSASTVSTPAASFMAQAAERARDPRHQQPHRAPYRDHAAGRGQDGCARARRSVGA